MLVGEIQIEPAVLLGDTYVNSAPGRIELGLGFQRIEGGPELRWRWGSAGRFLITAPQPRPEPDAANRPGFRVAVDHEIGKGGAIGGVEQLRTGGQLDEHGGRRHRPVAAQPKGSFATIIKVK